MSTKTIFLILLFIPLLLPVLVPEANRYPFAEGKSNRQSGTVKLLGVGVFELKSQPAPHPSPRAHGFIPRGVPPPPKMFRPPPHP